MLLIIGDSGFPIWSSNSFPSIAIANFSPLYVKEIFA